MEEAEGERELCHPFGLHALPNVGLVTPGYVAGFHLEFDEGKKEDIKPGELGKVLFMATGGSSNPDMGGSP